MSPAVCVYGQFVGRSPVTVRASRARNRNGAWVFEDGTLYQLAENGEFRTFVRFREQIVNLRAALLDLHEHALAHAAAKREFVEGLATGPAQSCDASRDRAVHLLRGIGRWRVSQYIDSHSQ